MLLEGEKKMEIGEAVVQSLIVHQVGNRLREEPLILADHCTSLTESISNLILGGYLRGIVNEKNLHLLTHQTDLTLNEIAHHSSLFFSKKISFEDFSKRIATHLYGSTHHPNIAAGDLFIVIFDKVKLNNIYRQAIGIYKSESKQQYISQKTDEEGVHLEALTGINPELIDKGALIVEGTSDVYALDRLSQRTKYWLDDFLKAKQIPDKKMQSTIAIGMVEKISTIISDPKKRQDFGKDVMALCLENEEVRSSELREISEKYVPNNTWESELERVIERKGLIEIDDINIPSKTFESKLKKTLRKVHLGQDIILALPINLTFGGVDFQIDGRSIQIQITLENEHG